jgi:hypothetical protein
MDSTRECPVCGTTFPASTGRGQPRVYCGDACRGVNSHRAAAERGRRRNGELAQWSTDDLLAWAERTDFGV